MTIREQLVFAAGFLKYPRMLGSFLPSSRFLAERLLRQIDFARARVIVEYGPGMGNLSEKIVERMRSDARLVLIEMNPRFAEHLTAKFNHDERVTVVKGSAAMVSLILGRLGLERADVVVSGIPYATMPDDVRQRILDESRRILGENGVFLAYQFSSRVRRYLEPRFSEIREEFEPRNILPARLFFCTP